MRKIALFVLLTAFAAAANAVTLRETIDKTFDVRAGAVLKVDNVNGRISVSSWDQPRIRIQAEKVVSRSAESDAKKIMSALQVDIAANANGVTARTIQPNDHGGGLLDLLFGGGGSTNVNYTVTVPRSANVHVSNTNGGVQLTSVSGEMRVETTNGGVDLTRCAGAANVETTNGHIHAELASLAPQKQVRLETTNGGIELIVPQKVAANVDAETTHGSVTSELPIAAKTSGRTSIRGAINGGGPDVMLRTTNGGIRIRAAQ